MSGGTQAKGILPINWGGEDNGIILYGAGIRAVRYLQNFKRIGIKIDAFVDNSPNRQGTQVHELPVMSFDEAIFKYPTALYIFAYNHSDFQEELAIALLRHKPVKSVNFCGLNELASIDTFTEAYPQFVKSYREMDFSEGYNIRESIGDIEKAKLLFNDPVSASVYTYIRHRELYHSQGCVPVFKSEYSIYYSNLIWNPSANERVIDCGAYTGDTLTDIISNSLPFEKYFGFEPDTESYGLLMKKIANLPDDIKKKCEAFQAGVGETCEKIGFVSGLGIGSHVSKKSGQTIEVVSLDSVIDYAPTFVKMDIEGFELAALKGGVNTIKKHRPVLAISVYHNPQDFFEIPLYINSVVDEYEFFIRTYEKFFDWILYAVPKERTL